MADYIYAELNDAALSVDYEGGETATAKVSVNPSTRTLTADVRKVPNALTLKTRDGDYSFDGSKAVSLGLNDYEIREIAGTGNLRRYGLFSTSSGEYLGVSVDVPSSKTLLSAEVLRCAEKDVPVAGYEVGEYYARFTCASMDGDAQENYYVYMLLSPILQGVGDLVDSERERAEEAEESLGKAIQDEAAAREAGDEANSEAVKSEEARAEGAEAQLESDIRAEAERAKAKEASLESSVAAEAATRQSEDKAIRDSVSDEISRASQAEGSLESAIAAEAKEREDADNLLQASIDEAQENLAAESDAREAKDAELDSATKANASAISAAAEARGQADSELSSRISTETSRAMGAETSLSTDLGEEIAARKNADDALRNSKQDNLISGTTIKTVNGQSLLGEGNIDVSGGVAVDAYTKSESDARYALKTDDVVLEGAVQQVDYSLISGYSFVVCQGYKNNIIDQPNQACFVLVPSLLNDGETNLCVPAKVGGNPGWAYGILFTKSGDTVSWRTDIDWSGDTQFLITHMKGVH